LNASEPIAPSSAPAASDRAVPVPRKWTLHGLNNGLIFTLTFHGVGLLPRPISVFIGHVGSWIMWRASRSTRQALADNLAAIVPDRTEREREQLALETLRSYTRDVIDFLRALNASDDEIQATIQYAPESQALFDRLTAEGKGVILVTGHYGNWELGGVAMSRVFRLPMTIVAMTEANETVNDIRRRIRDSLGADTVEVRKSLDTALQIRKRLGENRMVAMLMDRHMGRDRVAVTFLGRRTWFLKTPALMAFLSGAPLVPCFIERVGARQFRVEPGIPIAVDHALPREEALQRAAQQMATQLEARVRQNPQYWYHFYRYWDAQRDEYSDL
jgi:KDO2-lipid IV(A) lauroyltransferase